MYTMEDFIRDSNKKIYRDMTPQEQREFLQSLTPKELLETLSPEQIRVYLGQLDAGNPTRLRKPRRKK